jgi:EAL domain-containing protein (putative c-di-GMP-specific phosphodiesterase class I)
MRLRSLARLDLAHELREAIANGDIRFRYVGRHDLQTGRLVARVGYLRWLHPLRGEIRPAEFLRVAETIGLGVALSRSAVKALGEDFAAHCKRWGPDVRISFGALRDHFFHEDFFSDMERLIDERRLSARNLELRIGEKAFIAREARNFFSLRERGVQIVVDELGRGMSSLEALARAPVWGLQLDRSWVAQLRTDEVARKVCKGAIHLATAMGLVPIATGIDDRSQRDALLEMGCHLGSGDIYRLRAKAGESPDGAATA